jgi:hypothetical protein
MNHHRRGVMDHDGALRHHDHSGLWGHLVDDNVALHVDRAGLGLRRDGASD